MPADYRNRLSDTELNDLASYLMTTPDKKNSAPLHKKWDDERRMSICSFAFISHSFGLAHGASAQKDTGFQPRTSLSEISGTHRQRCQAGNGCHRFWLHRRPDVGSAGFLYVSDETINKIFRVYPDGKKEEVIALGDPDGNTFDPHHRLIDCASVLRAIIEVTPGRKIQSAR